MGTKGLSRGAVVGNFWGHVNQDRVKEASYQGTMTPKKKRVSQKNELVVRRKLVHRQNGYFVLFVRLVTFVT